MVLEEGGNGLSHERCVRVDEVMGARCWAVNNGALRTSVCLLLLLLQKEPLMQL